MIDRQVVWSNPEVQKLLSNFVLAADEVWNLQNNQSNEGKLFQKFSRFGHYGDRPKDYTRQGIYVVTPSGTFLNSWNTRQSPKVIASMTEALAAWEATAESERYPKTEMARDFRWSDKHPEDGLALIVYTRDMPRTDLPTNEDGTLKTDWRYKAWNQDRLWLSKAEVTGLRSGKGLPESAANRVVRLHGRDNARGQSQAYKREHVIEASLQSKVVKEADGRTVVELTGVGRVQESGSWPIHDRRDQPSEQTRSLKGSLRGRAVWQGEACVEFELAWVGDRLGATQYNGRWDDPGPAKLGVVFVLAPKGDRIPPSMIWQYGWKN